MGGGGIVEDYNYDFVAIVEEMIGAPIDSDLVFEDDPE